MSVIKLVINVSKQVNIIHLRIKYQLSMLCNTLILYVCIQNLICNNATLGKVKFIIFYNVYLHKYVAVL